MPNEPINVTSKVIQVAVMTLESGFGSPLWRSMYLHTKSALMAHMTQTHASWSKKSTCSQHVSG